MALTTANAKTVLEATIYLPRAGVWHADLVVDTRNTSDLTGTIALSIVDGQLLLTGSSLRVSPVRGPSLWDGLTRVRLAGGAAGLGTQLAPQGYTNAPAQIILGDILGGAGEKLSATSSPAVLGTILPAWARLAQSAGTAITVLADKLGATWRVLVDGTVWIGNETWPTSSVTDYNVLKKSTVDGRLEIGTSTPTMVPGTVFANGQVGRVVHRISANAVRTEVFYE